MSPLRLLWLSESTRLGRLARQLASGLDSLPGPSSVVLCGSFAIAVGGELCPFVLIVLGQGDWVSCVCVERFPFGSWHSFPVWLGVLLSVI